MPPPPPPQLPALSRTAQAESLGMLTSPVTNGSSSRWRGRLALTRQ